MEVNYDDTCHAPCIWCCQLWNVMDRQSWHCAYLPDSYLVVLLSDMLIQIEGSLTIVMLNDGYNGWFNPKQRHSPYSKRPNSLTRFETHFLVGLLEIFVDVAEMTASKYEEVLKCLIKHFLWNHAANFKTSKLSPALCRVFFTQLRVFHIYAESLFGF